MATRIYLDNAATSWPKPDVVYAAMDRFSREIGAPAGRSAYGQAVVADRVVESARSRIAQLLDAPEPSCIAFTFNGTDALNTAIHGVLRGGDHVVTSDAEHNSVLRPLAELRKFADVEVTHVPVDHEGRFSADDVLNAVQRNTRLVVLTHASNVTGAVQPLEEIGRRLADLSPLFLVDAAQSLGHWPFSVRQMHVDLLAAPGHKGLLGPLGTGILYIRPGIADEVSSLRQGGTGTVSEVEAQPSELPHKYEAGSRNVVGIAGLGAAVDFLLNETSIEQIQSHERELTRELLSGLGAIPGVEIVGPPAEAQRVAVVSATMQGYDPHDIAAMLDATAWIQTRAGLHCAPRIHRALQTFSKGGTVRFSPGHATSHEDIKHAADALRGILSEVPANT